MGVGVNDDVIAVDDDVIDDVGVVIVLDDDVGATTLHIT